MAETRVQAGLKLDPDMIEALDAIAAEHSAAGLARVTRADIMRDALATAIAAHRRNADASPARRRARSPTT